MQVDRDGYLLAVAVALLFGTMFALSACEKTGASTRWQGGFNNVRTIELVCYSPCEKVKNASVSFNEATTYMTISVLCEGGKLVGTRYSLGAVFSRRPIIDLKKGDKPYLYCEEVKENL